MVRELDLNKLVFQKAEGGLNNYWDLDLFGSTISYFSTQIKFAGTLLSVLFFDKVIPIFQTIFKGFLNIFFEKNLGNLKG